MGWLKLLKTDMGKTYNQYRRSGRFFGRRVNCEHVPALPASVVRRILDDPRQIALSGVACKKRRAIFPYLAAPNPAAN